jgi:hypothetical protein
MRTSLLTALIVSLFWALIYTRAEADADRAILILEGRVEQLEQALEIMSLSPAPAPAQAKPKRNPLVV